MNIPSTARWERMRESSDTCWIQIASWEYYCTKLDDGRIELWHHVPKRSEYDNIVYVIVPDNFLTTHSVSEFYDIMARKHCYADMRRRDQEIEQITNAFHKRGWIS